MPSRISAAAGSISPDPGGMRAAGTLATGQNGESLEWTGAQWQLAGLPALVSEAGNVTAAAIRTTTGTPGQVVKLADGDDKGMLLQWLIPAGSTSYAWCWFLSPNDAY